eukprot:GFUD01014261.1.p2 GENE.GFUD01014261.1~~GFUD01014261.1.p2  ORF type:complete len:125 (+),score=27.08 GFUD01014261.1:323-697(+)
MDAVLMEEEKQLVRILKDAPKSQERLVRNPKMLGKENTSVLNGSLTQKKGDAPGFGLEEKGATVTDFQTTSLVKMFALTLLALQDATYQSKYRLEKQSIDSQTQNLTQLGVIFLGIHPLFFSFS